MGSGVSFLFLLLLSKIGYISSESILRLPSENEISSAYCDSWRLAVETNNAGVWNRIPDNCLGFVEEYMRGERYTTDSEVVGNLSSAFAKSVRLVGDGKDAWFFDIDETLLSNVPYYNDAGFG
jgi:hypothetical protein